MIKPILRDFPFPILTPRLVIAPACPGTGREMFEALEETRESLARWMPWEKVTRSWEDSEDAIRRSCARFILREDFWLHARERESGRMVVFSGFHHPDWDIGQVEIGYWVRKSAQGAGYATESTNALIRYAFNAMGMRRVVIGHAQGNDASRRVIEKLGFVPEYQRTGAHKLPDDRLVDDFGYVRLNAENLPPLDVSWGAAPA
jgi:RimJ/RimL family protein N-acetyltransferase